MCSPCVGLGLFFLAFFHAFYEFLVVHAFVMCLSDGISLNGDSIGRRHFRHHNKLT
jgi:hypothetical protein